MKLFASTAWDNRSSKWTGRLDVLQSASGLALTLFLWTHLLLVGSILLGGDAMAWVARTMELAFLSADGHGYPWIVTLIAIAVGLLTLVHMLAVLPKLPANLRQQHALAKQITTINHADTRLWVWQLVTGLIIMLALPVHLWLIGSAPETVGPVGSAQRIWQQHAWLLYMPLLLAVELHAAIGIYRLVIKWGSVCTPLSRQRLKTIKNAISVVFILIGIASLLAFLPYAN